MKTYPMTRILENIGTFIALVAMSVMIGYLFLGFLVAKCGGCAYKAMCMVSEWGKDA